MKINFPPLPKLSPSRQTLVLFKCKTLVIFLFLCFAYSFALAKDDLLAYEIRTDDVNKSVELLFDGVSPMANSVQKSIPLVLTGLSPDGKNIGTYKIPVKISMSVWDASILVESSFFNPRLRVVLFTPTVPRDDLELNDSSLWLLQFVSENSQSETASGISAVIRANLTAFCDGTARSAIIALLKEQKADDDQSEATYKTYASVSIQRSLKCAQLLDMDISQYASKLLDSGIAENIPAIFDLCFASAKSRSPTYEKVKYLLAELGDEVLSQSSSNYKKGIRVALLRQLAMLGKEENLDRALVAKLLAHKDKQLLISLLNGVRNPKPRKEDIPIYVALMNATDDNETFYGLMRIMYSFDRPRTPGIPMFSTFDEDPEKYIAQWKAFIADTFPQQ